MSTGHVGGHSYVVIARSQARSEPLSPNNSLSDLGELLFNQAHKYAAAFWGSAAYNNLSGGQANIESYPLSPNYIFWALEAGKYYLWRVLIAVGTVPGAIDTWTISFPNGSAWLNVDTSNGNPNVVWFSCDGVSAPRRPPFPGTF